MISLTRSIIFNARKIKVNLKSANQASELENEQKPRQKIPLSNQQLLEMREPRGRSAIKIFKDRYQELGKFPQQKSYSQQQEEFNQSEKSAPNYERNIKSKYRPAKFKQITTPHTPIQERMSPSEASLSDLSHVRLTPQYLPELYLKQTQKVFHKYGQKQLKQIASYFSKMMRLRYTEQKIDYELYEDLGFKKLQAKLDPNKVQEPIYLIGRHKIYQENDEKVQTRRAVDDQPLEPEINYTQNIVVSYMLVRSPRTFAAAVRCMTEIKFKYETFKPRTFIDFGSGLGVGCMAFLDTFESAVEAHAVEPAPKMKKMNKYLTKPFNVQHYTSLGELSTKIKQVDLVYAGYVLNELNSDLIEVYLEALWAKVKPQGFLILTEYGNPFGARLIHTVRKWILQTKEKSCRIVAPCPHHMKCPLVKSKQWCHFDQPSGMYQKSIFGSLPNDNSVQLEKFSYLIIQNTTELHEQSIEEDGERFTSNLGYEIHEPNVTAEWDRILFPLKKRGKHFHISLCTKTGRFENRVIAKSHGEQYQQGKKLRWGDLWRYGKRIPNKFRKERKTGRRIW